MREPPFDADIEGRISQELARVLKCSPEVAVEYVSGNGEIDSLHGVELLLALEREFSISIDDGQLTSRLCRSITQLTHLVKEKMEDQYPKGGVLDE